MQKNSCNWNDKFEKIAGMVLDIPRAQICPDPYQPRKRFRKSALVELAESIKDRGLQVPITVNFAGRKDGKNFFIIDAGERRWKAHHLIQKDTVRCVIQTTKYTGKKLNIPRKLSQTAENFQREEHTNAEIIGLLKELVEERTKQTGKNYGSRDYAIKQLSQALGKSVGWANQFAMLSRLKSEFIDMLDDEDRENALSFHVAISLSNAPEEEQLRIFKESLAVKELDGVNAQRSFIARESRSARTELGEKMRGIDSGNYDRLPGLASKVRSAVAWYTDGRTKEAYDDLVRRRVASMRVLEIEEVLRSLSPPMKALKELELSLEARRKLLLGSLSVSS